MRSLEKLKTTGHGPEQLLFGDSPALSKVGLEGHQQSLPASAIAQVNASRVKYPDRVEV